MVQMKGKRVPQHHFTWGERWALELVSVNLGSHLHSWQEMTHSQISAANNINLVVLKSNFVSCVHVISLLYSLFFAYLAKIFEALSVLHAESFLFINTY